jgi:Fe2+ or Zn2+ uptake regulation protein
MVEYRRYRHSELQNTIIQMLADENCILKKLLRKKLDANPKTFYKAVRALVKKGLVKEIKLEREKVICLNI